MVSEDDVAPAPIDGGLLYTTNTLNCVQHQPLPGSRHPPVVRQGTVLGRVIGVFGLILNDLFVACRKVSLRSLYTN